MHAQQSAGPAQRWTEAQAMPGNCAALACGREFSAIDAINELEMWQADTFDPVTIDRELGWAEVSDEHDARVSAQPSVGTGPEGI